MWRPLLTVAAGLMLGGFAVGQNEKDPPRKELTEAEVKEAKRGFLEAYLKKNQTEVPELPELATKVDQTLADLLETVKVSVDDKPSVRAAKRALLAENERRKLMQSRIQNGQFTGSAQYLQLTDTAVGFYTSATLIWTDPEKLLPFAECMAAELLNAELFNAPRVEQGVEEPQLLPQLRAARLRAEVTVLQLREKAKTK